jgi:uncharacterized protein
MKWTGWLGLMSALCMYSASFGAAQEIPSVEARIKTLVVDPTSQVPVVILETMTDGKLLPIWIDVPEAKAIALELERVKVPRPLTHDLIRDILHTLQATLHRVTITEIRDSTYFAVLLLRSKGQELQIDARPSDAIAVALRMKAPIYVATQVLAKAKALPPLKQSQKRLGVQTQDLTVEIAALLDIPHQPGVVVTEVARDGVALSAGIQRGDVITKANGQPIQSARELEMFLQSIEAKTQIKLEVIKKGKPTVIVIDLRS